MRPARASRRLVVVVGAVLVVALAGIVWLAARPAGSAAGQVTASVSPAGTSPWPAGASPTVPGTGSPAAPAPGPPVVGTPDRCTQDDPCLDSPAPAVTGADVPVLVTSSGWDAGRSVAWVAAEVGVLDPSGTCTATLRHGTDKVVQEAPAEPGPRTTSCAVEVEGSRLTAGEWLVSLSYVSPQHSGSAADVSINVP